MNVLYDEDANVVMLRLPDEQIARVYQESAKKFGTTICIQSTEYATHQRSGLAEETP